jgi:protein-S-isoprenylcysteine O-methyltransferase Ste14
MRWTGAGVIVAYVPLSRWMHKSLAAKLNLQEGSGLVTDGPYAYVRHPMCAGLLLCAIATCLITADYGVMISVAMVAAMLPRMLRREEAALLERFGDAYHAYRQRTPALVPLIGGCFIWRG